MDEEIRAAVAWWIAQLRPHVTEEQREQFGAALAAALPKHLRANGWERAKRGESTFRYEHRRIGFERGVAPVLLAACKAASISPALLPRMTQMFIDPGFVGVAQSAEHPEVAGVRVCKPLEVIWRA